MTSILDNIYNRYNTQSTDSRQTRNTALETQWLDVLQAVASSKDKRNVNAAKLAASCLKAGKHESDLSSQERQSIRMAYLRSIENLFS